MEIELKEYIHPKKFIALLSVLTVLLGIAAVMVAEIFILPLGALFALLLWFEPKRKLCSIFIPIFLLAFSFLGGVGGILYVCIGLFSGFLLWFCYKKGIEKNDTVFILTAFFVFYIFLTLFFVLGAIAKDYSFSAVLSCYEAVVEKLKVKFISAFSEIAVMDEAGSTQLVFNDETLEMLFVSFMRLTVAYIVISGFVFCGVVCKMFSFAVRYAQCDESRIRGWKFQLPNLFVYFYLAVFILSALLGAESAFGIALQNLNSIFMAVFAYHGIAFLFSEVKKSNRRGLYIPIVLGMLMLFAFAVQILSYLGAYATIVANRALPKE